MYEICERITAKMLPSVVPGNTAGREAWRRQVEVVKLSDLEGIISMTATIISIKLLMLYIITLTLDTRSNRMQSRHDDDENTIISITVGLW